MMVSEFLIAPDFPPDHFAGWHLFNAALQRATGLQTHLLTPSSLEEQSQIIQKGPVDLIYANPFDAATLVREKGYLPLVKPIDKSDEMVIVAPHASPVKKLADLKSGMTIAITNNYDVKLIGLRLLEAVDLTESDLNWLVLPSFQAVARTLINDRIDAGFFVASAYYSLHRLTVDSLRILMESHLKDITHVVLIHPNAQDKLDLYRSAFINMATVTGGQRILDELDIPLGFSPLEREEAEFMIDLMDTLLD